VGYSIPMGNRNEIREVHHVKCMVCSFVKGKDVILGPKVNTFEKHAWKTKVV
jgi:hypothetical protein